MRVGLECLSLPAGRGNIQADKVSDLMIAFWDVMPTLAELAGLNGPKDIDGRIILAHLERWKSNNSRSISSGIMDMCVRLTKGLYVWEDYKGISITDKKFELYNLKDDPGETKNIADMHPDIVRKISAYMVEARGDSENYPIRKKQQLRLPSLDR